MRDWYSDWESEKEDREEEMYRAHMARLAAEAKKLEPKAEKNGQLVLPLEV